ncbi:MAG: hypothetical protein IE927_14715, partial [Rhodobacterales bacterium]|nr:hypothetical protein [Rhodobacterales bacterium]
CGACPRIRPRPRSKPWSRRRRGTGRRACVPCPRPCAAAGFPGHPADDRPGRDALAAAGGDPARLDPAIPVDFICDHSLVVYHSASPQALALNRTAELDRNAERFAFIKWCGQAFGRFRVVPPGQGIMHQINLERLSTVVRLVPLPDGRLAARPDTMIGTDSHTTMAHALGILGWGLGGIEAEAAMLGLALDMAAPRVLGLRLTGRLAPGVTATDLVLHVTELLRRHDPVGAFVEVFGPGLSALGLSDRATIANMSPEYGATCTYFPIDQATLDYLAMTGRDAAQLARIAAYARAQGLWHEADEAGPRFDRVVDLDLAQVEPAMAGPVRPDQRVPLAQVPASFAARLGRLGEAGAPARDGFGHGSVVIAAITSCTNTANPALMMAAGLLARNAAARGLRPAPWVKCSLSPGSRSVTRYLDAAGLTPALEALGFHTIGYGCATCNGNSGPLAPDWQARIDEGGLATVAVLSGNRNFEGRIHPAVKAGYLASPPLVIAAALAGSVAVDPPLGLSGAGAGLRRGPPAAAAAAAAGAGRCGDDRPHLAQRGDPGRVACRAMADRAGHAARPAEQLRPAPRQPRGLRPRHVRQPAAGKRADGRPPRQPGALAGSGAVGVGRGQGHAGRWRAGHHPGRAELRGGILARLGGQGAADAGCAGGAGRKL